MTVLLQANRDLPIRAAAGPVVTATVDNVEPPHLSGQQAPADRYASAVRVGAPVCF